MTKSQIFTSAHKLARTFEGNYSACFSLALTQIYSDMKNETIELTAKEQYEQFIASVKTAKIETGSEKQISWAKRLRKDFTYNLDRKVKMEIRKSWKSIEVAERIAYTSVLDLYSNADLTDANFYIQNR